MSSWSKPIFYYAIIYEFEKHIKGIAYTQAIKFVLAFKHKIFAKTA